jgi:hypothetical protein
VHENVQVGWPHGSQVREVSVKFETVLWVWGLGGPVGEGVAIPGEAWVMVCGLAACGEREYDMVVGASGDE